LQQLYDHGIVNFQKVEIRGRFRSGQSGAIVFPIMLFTPELDPTINHYRVLKYDDTFRVRQEAIRFNSLVSQRRDASVPYEEIHWFSRQAYPEKALLSYRDLVENAQDLKELLTCILELTSYQAKSELKQRICKALRDVLEMLYTHQYCNSDHGLPILPGFNNRPVSEIFAEIFPAEHVIIDEESQDESGHPRLQGVMVGIEAISEAEYQFKKKYLVREESENRFFRVDVKTRDVVPDSVPIYKAPQMRMCT
jgi:hypothetical protein